MPIEPTSGDVAGQKVVPGVAAHHPPRRPAVGEHHGDAAGAVVLVGHRVAVRTGDGYRHQVVDLRVPQCDAVDQLVAGLTMPTNQIDQCAAADPVHDGGLEALPVERHLEVVTHAAVDRDVRGLAVLDRRHAVDRA